MQAELLSRELVTSTFVSFCAERIRDRERSMYVGKHRSEAESVVVVSVPRHATEGRWLEATEGLLDVLQ